MTINLRWALSFALMMLSICSTIQIVQISKCVHDRPMFRQFYSKIQINKLDRSQVIILYLWKNYIDLPSWGCRGCHLIQPHIAEIWETIRTSAVRILLEIDIPLDLKLLNYPFSKILCSESKALFLFVFAFCFIYVQKNS